MHLRALPPTLTFLLGVALAQACTDTGQDCTPGTETCTCANGTMCLSGLVCVGGVCQGKQGDDTTAGPTTEPPDGTSTTAPNPTTTTTPDPTTTTTTGPDPITTGPDPSTTSTGPDPATSSPSSTSTTDTTDTTDASTTTTTGSTTNDTNDTEGGIIPSLVWYKIGELGEAHDVDFTPDGNLAVVGYVERIPYDEDAWLGVLDPAGKPQWERLHDGSWGVKDEFHAVAVDGAGNITAAGQSMETDMGLNVIGITWDPQGTQLKVRTYGHQANLDDLTYGAGVDADGNPYLCAWRTPKAFEPEAWVVRYNEYSGAYWNKFGGADEVIYDCEVTPMGYLVSVATYGQNASIHRKAPLNGDTIFRVDYKLMGSSSTMPKGVTIDNENGHAYVTGYSGFGFGTDPSPFIGRWSTSGGEVWVKHPPADGDKMIPEDVVIDADGNLRIVGGTILGGIRSLFILTFDKMGNELDRTLWTAPEGDIRPLGVATRGDTLFVVGGTDTADPKIFLASFAI